MTLELLTSAALMGYTMDEQTKILKAIESGATLPTKRLNQGLAKVEEVFDAWQPVVEGYAGFPIEPESIQKKKSQFKDDRNVGRVVQSGGNSVVITGKKSDGRYVIINKDGKKTAKAPGDMGLQTNESCVNGVDIEDLHNFLVAEKMDGKDDNGFKSCWKGYKNRGTKMKGGKEVNDCVKEAHADKKPMVKVAVDPKKLGYRVADIGPDGKEHNVKTYGAMKKEEYVDEATAMAKRGYDEAPIRNAIAKKTGGGSFADKAGKLADTQTYGQKGAGAPDPAARTNLARKQRGDFRNTTSSSPGLHGYGHQSSDPAVKAKQSARGAQRGALTPVEKKSLNREQLDFLNKISDSNLFTDEEIRNLLEGMS